MKSIRYNLWKIKHSVAPRDFFAKSLWSQLDNAWTKNYEVPRDGLLERHIRRMAMAVISSFVICASVATSAFAYSSSDVTSGNILYPIKQTLEKVEEKVKATPAAKARFYLKQLARREAEKKSLVHRNKTSELLEEQIEKTEKKLQETTQRLAATDDLVNHPMLRQKIKERLAKRHASVAKPLKS